MRLVAVEITGRTAALTDDRTWARSRVEAAASEAVARGIASGAPANLVGLAAVSLWANETGWGRKERRYNVGSVHCVADFAGDCMRLADGELLRAYPRLDVAVSEWFGLVQSEYPEAWAKLAAGDLSYWSVLQVQGYGGHVPARDALSIYRRLAGFTGYAGMDSADEASVSAAWRSSSSGSSSSSGKVLLWGVGAALVGKLAGWW